MLDGALTTETLDLWRQDYSILTAERLSNMWTKAIEAGPKGQPILDGLSFEFNTQTPGIFDWIRERGANFVTACTREQHDAIAALISKKMRDGHTVDELARLIRPCIGLTEGQAKANARYYDSIVANLKKEHPRMKPESIRKKAQDAALKYAERQHRQRAMTIAQTESAFAYNRGADEGIRQAQSQGLLGTMLKRWSTSGDDQVCSICQGLEGVELEMDKGFNFKGKTLFAGQDLMPPAHPRCACAVEYIEVDDSNKPYGITENENIGGLSAGIADGEEKDTYHDAPQYLGSLESVTDDMVQSSLEKYESEIVSSAIENAIVITQSGLIWHCFGNHNTVFPDIDLGNELKGASVTHNHPIGSVNEYSFSNSDINLFMENNLKVLRGIDEYYVYELTRNMQELDEHIPLFELTEYDTRHEIVIEMARKLGIGYRRWRR